jgi:hypothetical protein
VNTLITRYWLQSPADKPKLRVGLLLDSNLVAGPFADAVRQIQQSNFAAVVLRIYNSRCSMPPTPSPRKPALRRATELLAKPDVWKALGWTVYDKLDARICATERAILSVRDIEPLIQDVPRIDVEPVGKGFVHRFPQESLDIIREYSLDVLVRFGFNILKGDILQAATYGVWSYHHGDNDYYRGGPSHYWEIVENHPHSGVILQILNEKLDDGIVLCKGLAPTEAPWLSRNRIAPYLLGSTFLIRKLFELHRGGEEELKRKQVPAASYRGIQKIYRRPGNWQTTKFLAPMLMRKAVNLAFQREVIDHWRIAVRVGAPAPVNSTVTFDTSSFRWLDSPRGRFWADPFLYEHQDQTHCFFEDYDYKSGLGRISVGELTPDGNITNVTPVLSPPSHLSYPFVFQDSGEIFMIPESGAGGAVVLYRATAFPYEWRPEATLLDVGCFDTTIVRHGGLYWLFTSVSEPVGASPQLVLMYSKSLTGPYRFHYCTPLSSDCRYARPAGRIIQQGGELIRPAQDATGTYGSALHFHRILEMSPDEYREELILSVGPPSGFRGIHTYDASGKFEVIDGKKRELARHVL